MENSIRDLAKRLRSYAKRCKDIKFTTGLLLTFLMTGALTLTASVSDNDINKQKQSINNSISDIRTTFKKARNENSRLLRGANLELVQLMEQGDQVVKSPWSSWQFGANYFYSNFNGTFKGRGDKAEKYPYEGIFQRSSNVFERSTSPLSTAYSLLSTGNNPYSASSTLRQGISNGYGIASTEEKQEPLLELNVEASIRPKTVDLDPVPAPTINISAPVLQALNIPNISVPNLTIPAPAVPNITLNLPSPNTDPFSDFCFTCGSVSSYGSTAHVNLDSNPGWKKFETSKHNVGSGSNKTSYATEDKTPNFNDGDNHQFWTGFMPAAGDTDGTQGQLIAASGIDQNARNYFYNSGTLTELPKRAPLVKYLNNSGIGETKMAADDDGVLRKGFQAKNMKIYVAGNIGAAGETNYDRNGAIGIHTVWDGYLRNIQGYLYGRAAFLSIETWHAGKNEFKDVSVKIVNGGTDNTTAPNDNTIFYIYPATYETLITHNYWAGASKQRGGFSGTVDADLTSNKNAVYSLTGAQGSFNIDSKGTYRLEGSGNLVYSGLGYSPNYQNLIGEGTDDVSGHEARVHDLLGEGMTPTIKLTKAPESYGDENVILLFNNRVTLDTTNVYDYPRQMIGQNNHGWRPGGNNPTGKPTRLDNWKKSGVGIFQGEIAAKAIIGNKLAIDSNATSQTAMGNSVGTAQYVENNIGIFARSGQRPGITPSLDLGAIDSMAGVNFDKDAIHSLQINDIDINFGKYSKDGIMMVSEKGTILDVARSTNLHTDEVLDINRAVVAGKTDTTTVPIMTGDIKDYIGTSPIVVSDDDNTNQAATGTIIAYSQGTWKNTDHEMSSVTATALEGKPSEINIGKNVVMSARYKDFSASKSYPIAYLAKDEGIINAEGTTEAKGYGSVIAYSDSKGVINTTGKITAKDEWSQTVTDKKLLFTNVGGVATNGGTVNINGGMEINGMGAFASGANSKVNVAGTTNIINTGTSGSLAAINGGEVNFGGGTITHKENQPQDHLSSAPFYADASSKINFNGLTTLNIANGILMPGTSADYAAAVGGGAKYNGMNNVTVNLIGNDVIIGTNDGANTHWTGPTGAASTIKQDMKLAAFNPNGHTYKIYYINGTFLLDTNLNLDDTTDPFNNLGLANEVLTINSGKTVSSTTGKGLSMGSLNTATSNATNAYINKGTVNITGGNFTATGNPALSIVYGTIDNQNVINVDSGIGAYGIDGSKLQNSAARNINITNNGIGMAAFASGGALQAYGTDAKITAGTLTNADKVFEIVNDGTITVAGASSMGIYGETNDVTSSGLLTRANGIINNNGKIVMTGSNGVGIVSKRATVNLSGTGSSDIATVENGIGVYAEDSNVNLNSPYGFEVKDNGTGIFVKAGSNLSAGNIQLKYVGSSTGTGLGIFYDGSAMTNITNNVNVNLLNTTNSTGGVVGLFAERGGTLTNAATITGQSGYGIISNGTEVVNNGTITLNDVVAQGIPSVGIYTQATDKITNNGTITTGGKSVGIYGHAVDQLNGAITIGNSGTGIYSSGGNVNLLGGTITIGGNKAVGVYTKGALQTVELNGTSLTIGDTSFGIINEGSGNTINARNASQTLGNDSVYVYSNDTGGTINNYTNLTSTGSVNYGLYGAGTINNYADMNLSSGVGNVGIYSINGGTAINHLGKTITVGASDNSSPNSSDHKYAIGMAAGYEEAPSGYSGNVINRGTINVNGEYSIGMYGSHAGTKVENYGDIILNANNTTGMYLDNGAYGINHSTIKTGTSGLENVTGVVIRNGAIFENNGTIQIDAKNARGLITKGNASGSNPGIIKNYGNLQITGVGAQKVQESKGQSDLGKSMGGVAINAPAGSTEATITVNGNPVIPEIVPNTPTEFKTMEVSTIGMYIDTSARRFTNPIQGLNFLSGLTNADLIIGNEAAEQTTSKYIQVDSKVLAPYNTMIKNNPQIEKWNIYSGALTWMASVTQDRNDGTIKNAYMTKIPYTHWAGTASTPVNSTDTYNFLDGLEQRYGVEGIGTRENQLFQKLSKIGKNEEILFYQATDEMMGHQYANVQQRTVEISGKLSKEINHLMDDWRNPSKENNKVKTFGMRSDYKTDTAGIIDYKSHTYGVVYVHEDETIKLGNSTGWYAGYANNRNKFKDIGRSKETTNMFKLGVFKKTAFDNNGSLQWTISGEGYAAKNDMKRRFLVVDEIFGADSTYYTYGVSLKNELSKDFRLSERSHLKAYGSIDLGYGRFSDIKEDKGEVRLEVDSNDYYSIKPEVGLEFKYVQPFARRAQWTASLGVAYETELGEVNDVNNKARVRYTSADWFGIRSEKENRKGNVKVDFNLGIDNQRVGFTLNAGYDTNGENFRGGIGFRAIY